jgi:23S rRNA-/tRNA-specific pseudouridylate synthase
MFSCRMVPCVIFEDEHLLVVSKPAGWNTHSPSPFAGEGIYDWLKNREPRWSSLAILHRLDKESSGVLVFGKTPLANKSLTEQFTRRRVFKKYLLLTDRAVPSKEFTVKTGIARIGEKYASRPGGETAETVFTPVASAELKTKNLKLKIYLRRTAHRSHASNPRPRRRKRIPDSRRHALRRHRVFACFFARIGNFLHSSLGKRIGEIFCAC